MNKNINNNNSECDYRSGSLPSCAPLATVYVPMQEDNPPVYNSQDALTRGTLFPGLDLPFKNITNKSNPYAGTPLGELMGLQFMMKELQLYLDTHSHDKDAFKALKETIALYEEGKKRYVTMYGPLTLTDMQYESSYSWLDEPWPWEYCERTGRK